VILVIAVALWIVWVAPYVLRNGRQQLQTAGEPVSEPVDVEITEPQAGTVLKMAIQQEKTMDIVPGTESARGTSPLDPERRTNVRPKPFRIRYGRCAIALIGLMSLLAAATSGALRLFSVGPSWVPLASLATAVATVALLRRLAVLDRRAKVQAAFRAAMSAPGTLPGHVRGQTRGDRPDTPANNAATTRSDGDIPLFDAEAPRPLVKPLTALELRQAALAEAAASGDHSVRSPVMTAGVPGGLGASWEPVEVPKPTYVEAAKAERAAPAPLELPESPKAAGKPSLKQGTAAAPPAASQAKQPQTKPSSALSNLDDVLQRRRA
jgi:hypothetical protein